MSRLLKTVVPIAAVMRGPLLKAQEKALDIANHALDIVVHGAGWSAVRIAAAYRVAHTYRLDTKNRLRQRLSRQALAPAPSARDAVNLAPSKPVLASTDMQTMAVNVNNEAHTTMANDAAITTPSADTPEDAGRTPVIRAPKPKASHPQRWPTSWIFSLALVLGLVIGAVFMATAGWLWLRMPYATEGVDFNDDGIMDSTRTVSMSGQTLRIEIDRNMDGKVDRIQTTNLRGQIETSLSDDDFDGVFESQAWFSNGQLESSQTDADADGFAEIRSYYPYGVKATTRHIDPKTHRDVRIEHFKLGVLSFAIEDIDGDGKINHRIDYSPTGQVLRTSKLKQQP